MLIEAGKNNDIYCFKKSFNTSHLCVLLETGKDFRSSIFMQANSRPSKPAEQRSLVHGKGKTVFLLFGELSLSIHLV